MGWPTVATQDRGGNEAAATGAGGGCAGGGIKFAGAAFVGGGGKVGVAVSYTRYDDAHGGPFGPGFGNTATASVAAVGGGVGADGRSQGGGMPVALSFCTCARACLAIPGGTSAGT